MDNKNKVTDNQTFNTSLNSGVSALEQSIKQKQKHINKKLIVKK
jgi:hypothetical protein